MSHARLTGTKSVRFVCFQTHFIALSSFFPPFRCHTPRCCIYDAPIILLLIGAAAYALGSNYNFEPGFGSGFDPIQAAVAKVGAEGSPYSELERDLIHAMATRSSAESKAAIDPAKFMFGELERGLCVLGSEELAEASRVGIFITRPIIATYTEDYVHRRRS